MRIRAVIFDFDGIILDTENSELESWREIYADHGCRLELEVWADCIGRPSGYFDPCSHLESRSRRRVDREQIQAQRRARMRALNAAQGPRPGVVAYLADARRLGLGIGLASSSSRGWVEGHLTHLGLLDYFQATVCSEDTSSHKPDPGPYLAALDRLGVLADEAIAFEDSPHGVTAAKAARILTVAVPNRVTAQLSLQHADLRLAEFSDLSLLDLLAQLDVTARHDAALRRVSSPAEKSTK